MTVVHGRRRRARTAFERFRRFIRYKLLVPVFRSPHPPEYTARGVANGVFWALTPSVGVQTLAILATWAGARRLANRDSSLVQALLWAWVNNPVTMVPLYYLFYVSGLWLAGQSSSAQGYDAFVGVWNSANELRWADGVALLAQSVGLPMAVGCVPYAVVGSALAYRWSRRAVAHRQRRKRRQPLGDGL